MAFHALADYQNHVIGWLQWEQSSLGDGAVVRFPRIWMSSGECRINRLDARVVAPEDFDLAFLRWDAGRYGLNALRELNEAAPSEGFANIQTRAEALLSMNEENRCRRQNEGLRNVPVRYPADGEVP